MAADLATLIQRLADAETALHLLMTSGRPVEVRVENDRITYQPQSADELRAYIQGLKVQIAAAGGSKCDGAVRRRPIRPYFGAR